MSLVVLVIMVVVGISAIVAVVHLTGGTADAVIADTDQARDRFLEDFPSEGIGQVVITRSRRTAFLRLGEARTGIVQTIGDRFLTRIAGPSDTKAITHTDAAAFRLDFSDFTWRGGVFAFENAEDCARVAGWLASRENAGKENAA